jgi:hypothetical protein
VAQSSTELQPGKQLAERLKYNKIKKGREEKGKGEGGRGGGEGGGEGSSWGGVFASPGGGVFLSGLSFLRGSIPAPAGFSHMPLGEAVARHCPFVCLANRAEDDPRWHGWPCAGL